MATGQFLCYQDVKGFRGYIPPHTPYTIRQIAATKYWLEADTIVALIDTGVANVSCDQYGKSGVLGLVIKEEDALKWLICGDKSKFIGAGNC